MDFEAGMDEAVELFDAEQKARETAQRLQEQNEYSILPFTLQDHNNDTDLAKSSRYS